MDLTEIQRMRSRRVQVSASLPLSLIEVVDRLASAQFGGVFNKTLEAVIRAGLVSMAAEANAQKEG